MSTPQAGPGLPRGRAKAGQDIRPIASGLQLPAAHCGLIDQSHERCHALGLSRIERPDYAPMGRADLNVARDRNRRLYGHAAPVMELLFDQIAGTESMVVLCDAMGTIIHSIGDDDFLAKASKVALQPGVNWSEHSKGTNAIGTALIDEMPTLVHADEHYMHANHFLTCSAAPILDPRGNILGVLDVTGDHRSYHQHTMGLVKMSARMIENHWLSDDYRKAMRLHFHARPEFIGTLMEGIVAVSPEGRVIAANRSAMEQLGLSGASLRAQSAVSLFSTTIQALVDHFRSPLATPMMVRTSKGLPVHLEARFEWASWTNSGWAGGAQADGSALNGAASNPAAIHPGASAGAGAVEGRGLAAGAAAAASQPCETAGSGLNHLRTGDPQMEALLGKVQRVINRDIPILILGETGTGKELLARAIHQDSQRRRRAFVAVNCASIPESLIEAELFGYEEGAFTGARRKGAVGKILQADGGTLFLDEIGDMPLALQAHLLRVLQERQVVPLGSAKSVPVDVSIICATHRDVRGMIQSKAFREDLYYRLNGLALRLPALRERTDLHALVRRLLADEPGCALMRASTEAMELFEAYSWPGNVRQLRNVLRTAAVMAGEDRMIRIEHLPDDFLEEVRSAAKMNRNPAGIPAPTPVQHPGRHGDRADARTEESCPSPLGERADVATGTAVSLEEMELQAMRRALEAAGGNISEASKRLGISRNTIYRKLRWSQRDSA